MTAAEFESLSKDLRTVASKIPLNWGHIQNNRYDYELKQVCDIFAVTIMLNTTPTDSIKNGIFALTTNTSLMSREP